MAGLVTLIAIAITIDDVEFNIMVRDPSKKELEVINAPLSEFFKQEEQLKALANEMEMLKREFSLNKEMSAESSTIDKVQLFIENKKLNRDIFAKGKEFETLKKSFKDHDKELIKVHEKRFDLLVSGEDKEKLKQTIVNSSISYHELFEYISKTVSLEREKK